jgi:hypothetical protein
MRCVRVFLNPGGADDLYPLPSNVLYLCNCYNSNLVASAHFLSQVFCLDLKQNILRIIITIAIMKIPFICKGINVGESINKIVIAIMKIQFFIE